jgi:hypothetical protein
MINPYEAYASPAMATAQNTCRARSPDMQGKPEDPGIGQKAV